jgi:hypothetical protein
LWEFNQCQSLILLHVRVDHVYQVLQIRTVSVWRLSTLNVCTLYVRTVVIDCSCLSPRLSCICLFSLLEDTEIVLWNNSFVFWDHHYFVRMILSNLFLLFNTKSINFILLKQK